MEKHNRNSGSLIRGNESDVLFVLGCPTFWLRSFAPQGAFTDARWRYVIDHRRSTSAIDQIVREVSAYPAEVVVILSHHKTLLRDAVVADNIRKFSHKRVLCQSAASTALAFDKRGMAEIARSVPQFSVIPEYSFEKARDVVSQGGSVIVKNRSRALGDGLYIASSEQELKSILRHRDNADYIVQPFVSGTEYSIVSVTVNGDNRIFEPVEKGRSDACDWRHPTGRPRYCPSRHLAVQLRSKMVDGVDAYLRLAEAELITELEFLVDDDGRLFFLEYNPRLCATLALIDSVSDQSCFEVIVQGIREVGLGGVKSAIGWSAEFPLTDDEIYRITQEAFVAGRQYPTLRSVLIHGQNIDEIGSSYALLRDGLAKHQPLQRRVARGR